MLNAIQTGVYTPSTKPRLEDLERQRQELSLQIAQEELAQPALTRDQIISGCIVFVSWILARLSIAVA